MVILDSTFLIDVERRQKRALARLTELVEAGTPLRVPPASWIEYLARIDPSKRQAATRQLESSVVFEALSREIADEAVRIQAELASRGSPLGWHDLQIAAAAAFLREPLISNDVGFRVVPGLEILSH